MSIDFEQKRYAEIEEHAVEDVILCETLVEKLRSDHFTQDKEKKA